MVIMTVTPKRDPLFPSGLAPVSGRLGYALLQPNNGFRFLRVQVVDSLEWFKLLRAHGGCLGVRSR